MNLKELFESVYYESHNHKKFNESFDIPEKVSYSELFAEFRSKKDNNPLEIDIKENIKNGIPLEQFINIVPNSVYNNTIGKVSFGLGGKPSLYTKLKCNSHKDEQRLNYAPILKDLIETPAFVIFNHHENGDVYYCFRFNKKA